jgi:hypothetical protein
MIVSLISEPRSGSNTLMEWFKRQEEFDVFLFPSYEKSKVYQNGIAPKNYTYKKNHLFIKEEFHDSTNQYTDLNDQSNFVIYLYRENLIEQVESWLHSKKTNNWNKSWIHEKNNSIITEYDINEFKILKNDFKNMFLNNEKNFTISYEELYYKNGIKKIIDYLKPIELKNINFPIGNRYRIDSLGKKLI